jgi:hypothetical protein
MNPVVFDLEGWIESDAKSAPSKAAIVPFDPHDVAGLNGIVSERKLKQCRARIILQHNARSIRTDGADNALQPNRLRDPPVDGEFGLQLRKRRCICVGEKSGCEHEQ